MTGLILIALMLICLLAGFYAGWVSREGREESRQLDEVARVAGRHARSWPLRLAPADPPTDELLAVYAAEEALFPTP